MDGVWLTGPDGDIWLGNGKGEVQVRMCACVQWVDLGRLVGSINGCDMNLVGAPAPIRDSPFPTDKSEEVGLGESGGSRCDDHWGAACIRITRRAS